MRHNHGELGHITYIVIIVILCGQSSLFELLEGDRLQLQADSVALHTVP